MLALLDRLLHPQQWARRAAFKRRMAEDAALFLAALETSRAADPGHALKSMFVMARPRYQRSMVLYVTNETAERFRQWQQAREALAARDIRILEGRLPDLDTLLFCGRPIKAGAAQDTWVCFETGHPAAVPRAFASHPGACFQRAGGGTPTKEDC